MPKMVLKFATEQNIDFGHIVKREARFPMKVLENGKLCINVNSCLMIG